MRRNRAIFCLLLCLSTLLSGCAFRPVDELYTLPKLPGDYQNLQAKIEEVTTGKGAEYSAPQWGGYTQPVQFQDMDGDGTLEALAFFKVLGDETPLKIYVFHLTDEGYEVGTVIEGDGTGIHSVAYENLNATPATEMVVSWQKSTNVNSVAVYSLADGEVNELLSTPYTATTYELQDVNMDNYKELLVINVDTVEGNRSRVDCYAGNQAGLTLAGSAPLSQGISDKELTTDQGYLNGEIPTPALYVTSPLGEGVVTDIFAWKDEVFQNVTLNSETGVSDATVRAKDKARPADINSDTVLELPVPVAQSGGAANSASAMEAWYQYDMEGKGTPVFTTYHNFEDGWYLILPDSWVNHVTVTQDTTSVVAEKRTAFGRWNGEKGETFLVIYRLTGPNRHMRNRLGKRFTLLADDTVIYCAEFTQSTWTGGLDESAMKERFKLSQASWPAG